MPIILQVRSGGRGVSADRFWQRFARDNPGMELWRALKDMGDFIHDEAVRRAPGSLGQAVDVYIEDFSTKRPQVAVGLRRHPRHAVFVHEGTGLFGEFRRPIVAPDKAFAFEASGNMVYARKTRGQESQPFLRDAIRVAEASYIPIRLKKLEFGL